MSRRDRTARQLRPVTIERRWIKHAAGSALIRCGDTHVLCTASLKEGVPPWREGAGLGWVTAEYDMLPASTHTRRQRQRGAVDGRCQEIQRFIGRILRSIVDMAKLGENTITVDCDVLQADGGTRTASVTGGFVALTDAIAVAATQKRAQRDCITDHIAAVSVGIVAGKLLLDLDYREDAAAEVDLNLAMTGRGEFVEIQGTAEDTSFSRDQLDDMVRCGSTGIRKLIALQKKALQKR